jgi:multidrug efflux pump subunit AcrB
VNRAIDWFARNPTAANLLMWFLIVAGLVTAARLHREEFPDISPRLLEVMVEYPGAAPAEVEQSVCMRIEEAVDGADGIDEMSATAHEGVCRVSLELTNEADPQEVLIEVKNRVDRIRHFPAEAEKPVVSRLEVHIPVIDLSVSGAADERTLKRVARRLRDELAALPRVTQVELHFARPEEISIEVSEDALRRHGLTLEQVAHAVRGSSLDLPGGRLRTASSEIRLRARGQAYVRADFERIIVMTRADGADVSVGELARVVDGFEEVDLHATADGHPALMVRVLRVGQQDALEIRDAVQSYLDQRTDWIPEGIEIGIWLDHSEEIRLRLASLIDNAALGLVLVLGVLAVFLRFRLAFWVAAGLPVVFLGALATFPWLGMSINTLTVMAFILALGIVVDDAIVVGENVHTHRGRSRDPLGAAIDGTREVYVPVTFGVLTTIAAFLPLMAIGGGLAGLFAGVGAGVIACLVFSLVEAQLILPAHLAGRGFDFEPESSGSWRSIQARTSAALEHFVRAYYGPFVERAMAWRYLTVAIGIGVLLLTLGLVAGNRIAYEFMPPVEGDRVTASIEMPPGTPAAMTREVIERLERAAAVLRARLEQEQVAPVVERVFSAIGAEPFQQMMGVTFDASAARGGHIGEVTLALRPATERDVGAREIARRWRELAGVVPEAESLTFSAEMLSRGKAIEVRLRGPDLAALEAAAGVVRERLGDYPGVVDLEDSFSSAQREIQLRLRPEARPLGLNLRDLAAQVRHAFYGEEVQRIQRGRDELRVMVRYPLSGRRSLGDLDELRVRTSEGAEVPLATVAHVIEGRGLPSIQRINRERVVAVSADVDRSVAVPSRIIERLGQELDGLLRPFPGVGFSFEGLYQENEEASEGLGGGFLLALVGIYALLAIPLRSYAQPLLIMSVIPFGTVGAIAGHVILGYELTFFSAIGIVALAGVVVNASLMLVHFANRERDQGASVEAAVRAAGEARFRPILLTSLTTFVGLLPLILERSVPLQMMIPMAISLAFGVLLSTVVTLVIVPCEYLIADDLLRFLRRRARAGSWWSRSHDLAAPSR